MMFPRLIDSINIPHLIEKLNIETVHITPSLSSEYKVIFVLLNDETGNITRAIQEDEILKTRIQIRKNNRINTLPSFWDVWNSNKKLSQAIFNSVDPNEEKWKCMKPFGYKLATTFMPLYAKSIYEYFNATTVLDPCSGWGDRLLGASSSHCVEKYIGFDPNSNLRSGYCSIMELMHHTIIEVENEKIVFDNNFECVFLPFEKGVLSLESNSFDLVFTSPPFFEYEIYCSTNPKYEDWIKDFYTPLFIQSCRCVKIAGYVAIYIDNTLSGEINSFLLNQVQLITSLKFVYKIGLQGQFSGKTRPVWVFQKMN